MPPYNEGKTMELTKQRLAEIHEEAGRHAADARNEDWRRAYGRLADAAEHLALRMDKYWDTPSALEAKSETESQAPVNETG